MKKTRHDKHTEIETLQNEHPVDVDDATAVILHTYVSTFELLPTPNLVANP